MRIIDLSNSLSATGLLAAAGLLVEELLSEDFHRMLARYLGDSLEAQADMEGAIKDISGLYCGKPVKARDVTGGMDTVDLDASVSKCGQFSGLMSQLASGSGKIKISRLEFLVCLSLVISFEKLRPKALRGTIPRLGTGSPLQTLSMFEKEKCIIDANARPVSSLFGAILIFYFKPFIENVSGVLLGTLETRDPIDDSIAIRIIEAGVPADPRGSENRDTVAVLEANIDDMTPEILSVAMRRILKEGALDYTITPVMMKKERTGFNIQVLCNYADADRITRELLRNTSTFGIRKYTAERTKLARVMKNYETTYGTITVKEGYLGAELVKVTPEFDDILRLSSENRLSPFMLYNSLMGELNKNVK